MALRYDTYVDNIKNTDDLAITLSNITGANRSVGLIVTSDLKDNFGTLPTDDGTASGTWVAGPIIQDSNGTRVELRYFYNADLDTDTTTVSLTVTASAAVAGALIDESTDAWDFTSVTEVDEAEGGFTAPTLSLSGTGLAGGLLHLMAYANENAAGVSGDESADFTEVVNVSGGSNIRLTIFDNDNSETAPSETLIPAFDGHAAAFLLEVAATAGGSASPPISGGQGLRLIRSLATR